MLASTEESRVIGSVMIRIMPRPVVLVHGFISKNGTLNSYVGQDQILSELALPWTMDGRMMCSKMQANLSSITVDHDRCR